MKAFWKNFWHDTQGQDLVEYALAAGLVAVAAVAAMPSLSSVERALSFLAVGAVLLLGGFFYQRLTLENDERRAPAGSTEG